MSGYHAIKAGSRKRLHGHMARPSMLQGGALDSPILASSRYHSEGKPVGDLAGTNLSYAEQMERPAQVVFLDEEIAAADLSRGMVIIYTATEGYFLDLIHPSDGYTTNCDVTPLSETELSGKTLPDGTLIP